MGFLSILGFSKPTSSQKEKEDEKSIIPSKNEGRNNIEIKDVYTFPEMLEGKIEIGELFVKGNVHAVNIGKDIAEKWKNLKGGKMVHYSKMLEDTFINTVLELVNMAKDKGYDGIVGLRSVAPTVVEGGVELLLSGNGFKWKTE